MSTFNIAHRQRQIGATLGAALLLGALAGCSATETEQPVQDLGQEQVRTARTSCSPKPTSTRLGMSCLPTPWWAKLPIS